MSIQSRVNVRMTDGIAVQVPTSDAFDALAAYTAQLEQRLASLEGRVNGLENRTAALEGSVSNP